MAADTLRELAAAHPKLLTRECECRGEALYRLLGTEIPDPIACPGYCDGTGRRLATLEELWDVILERIGPTYVGFNPVITASADKQSEIIVGWLAEVHRPLAYRAPWVPIKVNGKTRLEAAARLLIELEGRNG